MLGGAVDNGHGHLSSADADAHTRWSVSTLALTGSIIVALVLGLLVDQGWWRSDPQSLQSIRRTLHVATGAFFFGAGLLHLVLWRIGRDPRRLQTGFVLVLLGILAPWIVSFGHLLHQSSDQVTLSPFTTTVVAVLTLAVGLSALLRDWNRAAARPNLTATVLVPFVLLLLVAPLLVETRLAVDLGPRLTLVLELGVAVAWLLVAALTHVRLRRARGPQPALGTAFLVTLAVVWVFRAAATLDLQPWSLAAAVLLLCAGLVALSLAADEFTENAAADAALLNETEDGLHAVTRAYEALERQRQNVTHDARNVFLALRLASGTLHEHGDGLDARERERLRAAITEEIEHLEHLITRDQPADALSFDAHTVLASVIELERQSGLEVVASLAPSRAVGVPGDLARVVRNLLVNARRHAPGSRVHVELCSAGPLVRIMIRDEGPGIPTSVRRRLYTRGATGPDSSGSGLGLHISRVLMQQQGGSLELAEGPGTRFFLTLPAAAAQLAAELIPGQRAPHELLRLGS